MTDGDAVDAEDAADELLWPAARPASQSKDRVVPLMIDTGSSVNIVVKTQWYQMMQNFKSRENSLV
jgi:hypothetical protein